MSQNTTALPNELDLSAYWMPFTANRQFKAHPRMLVSAEGMHYTSADGRKILDGIAGLWCVNAGHGRAEIAQAVGAAAADAGLRARLPDRPCGRVRAGGASCTHRAGGLDRIFFANSGSEAVDTALKIALAYHRARGEGHADALHRPRARLSRRRLRGHRRWAALPTTASAFGARCLPGVDHLPHTHRHRPQRLSQAACPNTARDLADDLERSSRCTARRPSRR